MQSTGGGALFQCIVDGNPAIFSFKWEHRFQGKIIRSDDALKSFLIDGGRSLNISVPNEDDIGLYTCYASNGILDQESVLWKKDTKDMSNIYCM